MSAADVPPGGTPRHRGGPPQDADLEQLIAGTRPPETEDDMTLDRLLSALRAPGTADELSGLEATTAAFLAARAETPAADAAAVVVPFAPRARRRALAVGVGAAAVAVAVALGGAAAAYTGHLPRGLQELASETIGAPAPAPVESEDPGSHESTSPATGQDSRSGSASAQGPDVSPSAPALAGLCQAFADRGQSFASVDPVAYRVLEQAAARYPSIEAYCAANAPSHTPSATPSARPTDKPSAGQKPTTHPSPSRTPSGKPAAAVTGSGAPKAPSTPGSGR